MIESLCANALGARAAPLDAEADRHHKLMLRAFEQSVFEGRIKVLKPVRSGGHRVRWIEKRIGRTERHREILGNALGELCGYIALPHWRVIAGLETVDGGKRHLVIDAGIVDAERGRKETISYDFVGDASIEGNERYGKP